MAYKVTEITNRMSEEQIREFENKYGFHDSARSTYACEFEKLYPRPKGAPMSASMMDASNGGDWSPSDKEHFTTNNAPHNDWWNLRELYIASRLAENSVGAIIISGKEALAAKNKKKSEKV